MKEGYKNLYHRSVELTEFLSFFFFIGADLTVVLAAKHITRLQCSQHFLICHSNSAFSAACMEDGSHYLSVIINELKTKK